MSVLSRLIWIALLGAAALPAVSITSYELFFNSGSIAADPNAPNIVLFPLSEGYAITGSLDVFDSTTGQPVTALPLAGPFALRFTNASIGCIAALTFRCDPLTLDFSALVHFAAAAPLGVPGQFGVEGTSTSSTVIEVAAFGTSPLQISNLPISGGFSKTLAVPSFFHFSNTSNSMILSMSLTLPVGLADGESINLPDSLFLQVDTSSVPEPGTLAIVGAGLAGALWFRRRLS